MKWILDSLKEYFNFTKGERDGVIALAVLILLAMIVPRFIHHEVVLTNKVIEEFNKDVEAFNLHDRNVLSPSKKKAPGPRPEEIEFFLFDPNMATNDDWARLGLTSRQIQTIRNYQSKGGVFKVPSDLLKLYGIPLELKEKLANYAVIDRPAHTMNHPEPEEKLKDVFLDLNTTDSIQLTRLPGIGLVLSRRILSFRSSLGGFYSVEQVKEVYGLSQEVYSQIKEQLIVNEEDIKKLDINRCSDWQLARHPYISKHHARAITKFRDFQGGFNSVEEIKEYNLLPDSIYFRIAPYLSVPDHLSDGDIEKQE